MVDSLVLIAFLTVMMLFMLVIAYRVGQQHSTLEFLKHTMKENVSVANRNFSKMEEDIQDRPTWCELADEPEEGEEWRKYGSPSDN